MSVTETCFYLNLHKSNGEISGHSISSRPPTIAEGHKDIQKNTASPKSKLEDRDLTFRRVAKDFERVMDSYLKFLPIMLHLAPEVMVEFSRRKIGDFAESKCLFRPDLSTESVAIYEISADKLREYSVYNDEIKAASEGAKILPKVMIIGIVSNYDAFLTELLRVVIALHEEIVLVSDKKVSFAELRDFKSVEEIRYSIIDKEIESVMRASHQVQFEWMEQKFGLKLRQDLDQWKPFVELCERRNLLTHTGGVVSAQYVKNCESYGIDIKGVNVGDVLRIGSKYYSSAVRVIYIVGIKLVHVLWRKFKEEEREIADTDLNELCYSLIVSRNYEIAEALLFFGTTVLKKHSSDRIRRMMIVNLANAVRLQKREPEAKRILDAEDWSACGPDLQICVAAVSGNKADTIALMRAGGASGPIKKEDFRTWPVFRGMRTDADFIKAFQDVFSEDLISIAESKIPQRLADGEEID